MKRILVIDDEVGARTLIGIMLERGGFEVLKAKDADQALNTLQNDVPDLIVLDVMMPGMDGFTLCKAIRAKPSTRTTPILMLSAKGDSASVMEGMNAGASDYLPKPILHHDLVSKVQQMLGMTPAGE